jgi:hypothetical protein
MAHLIAHAGKIDDEVSVSRVADFAAYSEARIVFIAKSTICGKK